MSELTPNLKLFKYNTETDAKQPFSINDCMNANWDKIDASLGSLEICDIGMALYVDETKGKRRYLNGQIVERNANTEAFFTRLKEITTLHPSLLCTEEEWQTAKTMSAFGQVGKFVFNYSGNEIVFVRLPRVVNVQGLFDLQNLGMTVSAGLPNITGNFGMNANSSAGGAFIVSGTNGVRVGGSNAKDVNVSFDASRSSSIYGNSTTVQPEAIQYPYFIQIATGSETENNIINEIELNNPYSLFECKYADHELFNISWLKSNGQWNAKTVYSTAYEALQVEYNSEIQAGTTSTLPSGVSYTKQGLSVKLSTDEYTDYDFVLNTAEETFRLPIQPTLLNNTRYLIEKGEQNGISYRIYSDGWCEQCGYFMAVSNDLCTNVVSFLKNFADTKYFVAFTNDRTGTTSNTTSQNFNTMGVRDKKTNSFTFWCSTSQALNGACWYACGYLAEGQYTPLKDSIFLYYYVGETVQNANLIDAGRIGEQLANKVDISNTQWATNACMPDYSAGINISVPIQSTPYITTYDCYMQGITHKTYHGSFFAYISDIQYKVGQGNNVNETQSNNIYLFLPKGTKIYFTSGYVEASSLYVFPLKGAK